MDGLMFEISYTSGNGLRFRFDPPDLFRRRKAVATHLRTAGREALAALVAALDGLLSEDPVGPGRDKIRIGVETSGPQSNGDAEDAELPT